MAKCCCIKKELKNKQKKNNQGNANNLDLSMHGVRVSCDLWLYHSHTNWLARAHSMFNLHPNTPSWQGLQVLNQDGNKKLKLYMSLRDILTTF